MANRNQRVGTEFEVSVTPALAEVYGRQVVRLGKQGRFDRGDWLLPGETRFVLEGKREVSYAGKLSGWLTEAYTEAGNAGVPHGVVVHKRFGTADPLRQYVTMTLGGLLYIAHTAMGDA